MFTHNGRTYPRVYTPTHTSRRLQVSPRLRPERTEAGYSGSPSSLSLSSSFSSSRSGSGSGSNGSGPVPDRGDSSHFPSIPTATASSTPTRRSISGSPESVRSAWSTPLSMRMTRSEGPSSPRGGNSRGGSLATSPAPVSLLSEQFARGARLGQGQGRVNGSGSAGTPGGSLGDEDADLRFAIELSLAEARSRGEDV